MKFFQNNKLLLLTISLAFMLHFYQLGKIPASLNWDEVSNSYNAFSILKTQRDEYNNFLPLSNRSFNDYKPPAYMYLETPSIFAFNLTPFAARLPSALLGTVTVIPFFFLAKILFKNQVLASLSALFLVTSPWHMHFSRVGFEANIGLFALTSALCFFLLALEGKGRRKIYSLSLSSVFFAMTLYTYHAERLLAPLILILLLVIFRTRFFSIPKKYILLFFIIALFLTAPLLFAPKSIFIERFFRTSGGLSMAIEEKSQQYLRQENYSNLDKLLHNKVILTTKELLNAYLSNYSPNFLFTEGDNNLRHHTNGFAFLYIFQLPLIIVGAYSMIKKRSRASIFVFALLILSPIPSAFSLENPHAIRSYTLILPLSIFCASGVLTLVESVGKKSALFIAITLSIYVFLYLENYYKHYPSQSASSWQYGYSQAVLESDKVKDDYDKIIVNSSIENAYIFWLYYLKFDPKTFQRSTQEHYAKFYFQDTMPLSSKELLVSNKAPEDFKILKTIYYPNGQKAVELSHP